MRRRDRIFIAAKIPTGIFTIALAVWLARFHAVQIAYVLVPVVVLLILFAMHESTLRALRNNQLLRQFYRRGVDRLEDRWFGPSDTAQASGREDTGERFLDVAHPYARDLDIFGAGSLYHLLCTALTRTGKNTLAAWLLAPAPVDEILHRQHAVQELSPRLDFRERLALAGSELHDKAKNTGLSPEVLVAWAESTHNVRRSFRLPALILGTLWIVSICAWLFLGYGVFAVAMCFVNLAVGVRFRREAKEAAARIVAVMGDLDVLAGVLAVIEQQPFTAEKTLSLQQQLQSSGRPVSQSIASLAKRNDWLSSNDNWFVKVCDPFLFWTYQCVVAIEDWRGMHGASVRAWLSAIGEMEALLALSVFSFENPEHAFPNFTEDGPRFEAEGFAHPLLPRKGVICNSLHLDRERQMMMISGPNMAGKSTFIRSVGVNAVLAQAGAPVRARSLIMTPLAVAASICILDSLQGGLSRFYAEILRLKEIDLLSRREVPVLFLLGRIAVRHQLA